MNPASTCKFVAEVSSNHHQDLDRCLTFVRTARQIGCHAVKFQLFKIDELFAPEILAASETHRARKAWELPLEYLPHIAKCCREQDIQFGCTPFYLEAVKQLAPHVDFFKIASYELLWNDLILACARTGKPLVLSTGMANAGEIRAAVNLLNAAGCQPTLLHTISAYPTPPEECNLSSIEALRKLTHCPAGWSDHSRNPDIIRRAVLYWRSTMVEFHLDIDGTGEEFSGGHCWTPNQIEPLIREFNLGALLDGDQAIRIAPSEWPDREWRADPSDGLRPLKALRKGFKP